MGWSATGSQHPERRRYRRNAFLLLGAYTGGDSEPRQSVGFSIDASWKCKTAAFGHESRFRRSADSHQHRERPGQIEARRIAVIRAGRHLAPATQLDAVQATLLLEFDQTIGPFQTAQINIKTE